MAVRQTRAVRGGAVHSAGGALAFMQSMCATRTHAK
jgi:hypothetical protein